MEERKTVTVKLDVYEDQVEEFKALIYFLKNNLREEKVETLIKSEYQDIKIEDTGVSVFDKYIKSYIDFIRSFLNMVYVPSIDGDSQSQINREIPYVALSAPPRLDEKEEELSIEKDEKSEEVESSWDEASAHEYSKYPVGEEPEIDVTEKHDKAVSFINRFIKDRKNITERRQRDLARLITEYVAALQTENIQVDDFFLAAKNSNGIPKSLDGDLQLLVSLNKMLDFRYSSNVVFNDKQGYNQKEMKKGDVYLLAFDIYDRIKTHFKELGSENEEELLAVTGFILSEIGHIHIEEVYLVESNRTYSWLSYIIKMTKDWIERAER